MDSTRSSPTGLTDKVFANWTKNYLVWLPQLGVGHLAQYDADIYDGDYIDHYQSLAATEMGYELTQARIDMVARHYDGPLLDVGVGSGQFLEQRNDPTFGYDINPQAIQWLTERQLFADLYTESFRAVSFWDALEHIPDPGAAVDRAGEWVFVSLPIFDGPEHCLKSRHYKPGEHLWYWTDAGIRTWFEHNGFECIESNEVETDLGRDGIGSYAFRRIA